MYQQQLVQVSTSEKLHQVAARLHTLYSIKSSLYRIRRNRLPKFPKCRDVFHFEGEWTKTHAVEQFLMAEDGDGDDKIIIFQPLITLDIYQNLGNFTWMEHFRRVSNFFIRFLRCIL